MLLKDMIPATKSAELTWPAYCDGHVATILGLQYQLEQTQWWSASQIVSAQFGQLKQLLLHAQKTVPFYRQRFANGQWQPGDELTVSKWQKVPVLQRSEIQAAGGALWSQSLDSAHGKTSEVHTSGSTGSPVKVTKSTACDLMFVAVNLRDHVWHQRDLMRNIAMIRSLPDRIAEYPEGLHMPNWGASVNGLYPSGSCDVLSITATIEQQMEWLQRKRPYYLMAFPTLIEALARHALSHKMQLPELKQITTFGETLNPELRQLCRNAFDAELVDTYSAQEIGYMALQCPVSENYHVQSEAVYLEVLDANDQHCKPGEIGRIVVTPLQNFAMPLIRYAIGDYAEVGESCACGRKLPVLKRILGRSRNILTLPGGKQLWPRLSELRYSEIVPVNQFQMVQKSLEMLEVKLVPLRPVTPSEEDQLRALIMARIGHPFRIEFSYHNSIERSPNGKYEDFRSEI